MKLKRTDYRDLGKSFEEKFYYLCRNLFPNLSFSKIDRKGHVIITDRRFILFRKRVKKHITVILLNDITAAIAIKFWGNLELVGFYNSKVSSSFTGEELNNVRSAILSMASEYENRELSHREIGLPIHDGFSPTCPKTSVDDIGAEEPQEQPRGTAYFFDFVHMVDFIIQPVKHARDLRKFIQAAAFSSQMAINRHRNDLPILSFIHNKCRGDPHIYKVEIYNTS